MGKYQYHLFNIIDIMQFLERREQYQVYLNNVESKKNKGVYFNALKFDSYFLDSAIISRALSRTVVSSRTTHPPFGPGSMWKPTAEPFL